MCMLGSMNDKLNFYKWFDSVAKKQGSLFESYEQFKSTGNLNVTGFFTLNSIDRIEVRIAPLCLGEIRLKQIILERVQNR